MHKNTENLVKGMALGMLAGTAVGAAGVYVAKTDPRQMKKMVHKAVKTGEELAQTVSENVQHMMATF